MILLLLECVVVISADLLQELRTALLFCWGVCKGHPQGCKGHSQGRRGHSGTFGLLKGMIGLC